jgi:hypothetical protein
MRYSVTLLIALLVCLPLAAQDKADSPAMQEMMKKWQEAMTPGPAHKTLAGMEGTWDAEVKSWMGGPGAPPTVSKATSTIKMVLGGRYLQEEVSGQMMDQPFNGMGITGYDNLNKKYISFWIDNMGTGMSTMDGTMDQTGTVLTMYGKMDEPGTGEHGKNFKAVTRIVDKNKHVYEMYDLVLGEPPASKVMEIVYTRKK